MKFSMFDDEDYYDEDELIETKQNDYDDESDEDD
jgi:hypothetical protein